MEERCRASLWTVSKTQRNNFLLSVTMTGACVLLRPSLPWLEICAGKKMCVSILTLRLTSPLLFFYLDYGR
jgi:hypothetical protein